MDPVTTQLVTGIATQLVSKSKEMKDTAQATEQTEWKEATTALTALIELIKSLNVAGPAIGVATGQILSDTSEERTKAMEALVDLVQTQGVQDCIDALIWLLNIFFGAVANLAEDIKTMNDLLDKDLPPMLVKFIGGKWF